MALRGAQEVQVGGQFLGRKEGERFVNEAVDLDLNRAHARSRWLLLQALQTKACNFSKRSETRARAFAVGHVAE